MDFTVLKFTPTTCSVHLFNGPEIPERLFVLRQPRWRSYRYQPTRLSKDFADTSSHIFT